MHGDSKNVKLQELSFAWRSKVLCTESISLYSWWNRRRLTADVLMYMYLRMLIMSSSTAFEVFGGVPTIQSRNFIVALGLGFEFDFESSTFRICDFELPTFNCRRTVFSNVFEAKACQRSKQCVPDIFYLTRATNLERLSKYHSSRFNCTHS